MTKPHSPYGASGASRWMACPGSIAACRDLPETRSADAALGQAAHAAAEWCLRHGVTDADQAIGKTFESHAVDAEMAAAIQVYLQEVNRRFHPKVGMRLCIEQRVDLSWIHPEMFGTADALIIDSEARSGFVIDYKHGAGVPVEADGNPQLVYYGLGPYFEHDLQEVTCVIVQPRCPHPSGPVRWVTYNREQLAAWIDRFHDAVAIASRPGAARHAGSHCRFCPAAATCPEAHRAVVAAAQTEFSRDLVVPLPITMSPDRLGEALRHADMIDAWIGAVRAYALSEAKAGHPPSGYKLVEGRRGNRRWTDSKAAAAELELRGIDPWEKSVMSPAAIEKTHGKTGKLLIDRLSHMVEQSAGSPQLAPLADRRPAIAMASAKSDFGDAPIGQ